MYNKRQVGSSKEQLASKYLEQHGYTVVSSNFYSRVGEIDLIATEGEYLVFIEVKYRSSPMNGYPEEAISISKMRALIKTAQEYLFRHGMSQEISCRFDVVVILGSDITVYQNAFDLNDAY